MAAQNSKTILSLIEYIGNEPVVLLPTYFVFIPAEAFLGMAHVTSPGACFLSRPLK